VAGSNNVVEVVSDTAPAGGRRIDRVHPSRNHGMVPRALDAVLVAADEPRHLGCAVDLNAFDFAEHLPIKVSNVGVAHFRVLVALGRLYRCFCQCMNAQGAMMIVIGVAYLEEAVEAVARRSTGSIGTVFKAHKVSTHFIVSPRVIARQPGNVIPFVVGCPREIHGIDLRAPSKGRASRIHKSHPRCVFSILTLYT
jgi:hypothetical protein